MSGRRNQSTRIMRHKHVTRLGPSNAGPLDIKLQILNSKRSTALAEILFQNAHKDLPTAVCWLGLAFWGETQVVPVVKAQKACPGGLGSRILFWV